MHQALSFAIGIGEACQRPAFRIECPAHHIGAMVVILEAASSTGWGRPPMGILGLRGRRLRCFLHGGGAECNRTVIAVTCRCALLGLWWVLLQYVEQNAGDFATDYFSLFGRMWRNLFPAIAN
jgi:hypothetical protein